MTGDSFKAKLADLGMTQEAFAAEIGRTLRQVNRYATGQTPVPKTVQMLLEGKKLPRRVK